ncbi:MAG: penicillin-binding protein 2 [Moraxellaceae bacterium]|nr:penicillin-binding protein 2 [Moraxellaceae bacterium]
MKRNFTFNHNPLLCERLPEWRARFVLVALLLGSFALAGRAMYLQGVNTEFLQTKGEARYARTLTMPANRGRILDRHGEPLAMSTPVKSIAAIPDAADLNQQQVRDLARVLEMEASEINRRLASERDFVFLKRSVSPAVAQRVADLKLPGVRAESEYRRYYPVGDVTAHVVGFTSIDDRGQEGIELAMDQQLIGKPGARRVIHDRRGQIVEDVQSIRLPQDGRDIVLSLDAKIQYLAHSALKQAVQQHQAKAGGVVVLDAKTGEVLALVNNPTYNPNNRVKLTGAQLRNRALTDSFEPGSTMKPLTGALALEMNKVRPDSLIDTNNGRLTIEGATITDAHPHGIMSVAEIIQKSSNVGSAKMVQDIKPEQMWNMFDALGFGSPLGTGFPGEVGGRLRPWKNWRPIEQATMAYGHGISVTLMQMAHSYQVFARGGELLPLSLTRVDAPPLHGKQVFSPEVTKQMLAMMETVTQEGGTAPQAQVPGYRVAGKTGTAYKVESGRYAKKYVSSFVGLAPASDPRLIVAVMIDEPSVGGHYGGGVAGPVFASVMGGALRSMGVRPDAPAAPQQLARQNATRPTGDAM